LHTLNFYAVHGGEPYFVVESFVVRNASSNGTCSAGRAIDVEQGK